MTPACSLTTLVRMTSMTWLRSMPTAPALAPAPAAPPAHLAPIVKMKKSKLPPLLQKILVAPPPRLAPRSTMILPAPAQAAAAVAPPPALKMNQHKKTKMTIQLVPHKLATMNTTWPN